MPSAESQRKNFEFVVVEKATLQSPRRKELHSFPNLIEYSHAKLNQLMLDRSNLYTFSTNQTL